jgi:hypothetical protein
MLSKMATTMSGGYWSLTMYQNLLQKFSSGLGIFVLIAN